MKILVDADACPKKVLQICRELGDKYAVKVYTIASFNHNIISDHHIVVGDADQETDIKVLNLTEARDIVITQDWGLAAMVLGKKARCISPTGREFSNENIDFLLDKCLNLKYGFVVLLLDYLGFEFYFLKMYS